MTGLWIVSALVLGALLGALADRWYYSRQLRRMYDDILARRAARSQLSPDEMRRLIGGVRDRGEADAFDLIVGATSALLAALIVYWWTS